jgi:hypothetical protein
VTLKQYNGKGKMKVSNIKGRQMQEIMGHSGKSLRKRNMHIEIEQITEESEQQHPTSSKNL